MTTKETTFRQGGRQVYFRHPLPLFRFFFGTWLVGLSGLLLSCSSASTLTEQSETAATSKDYFAEKTAVRYAKGFRIKYFNNYKLVEIMNPFEQKADTIRYVLVQRGTPHPDGYAKSQIIEIPLRSLVAMSSMHVGLVGFLEAEDILVGLGNLKYVSSSKVIQRIEAKKVVEVGKDQTIDEERLITMHPDLLMAVGSPVSRMDRYRTLTDAGVPVLINSEWVETTPLGRAEWVKLMAALLNQEKAVNQKFGALEKEYNRLVKLTRNIARKPTIISGMNSKDAWFVPDGDSYMTRFFLDAGATYPWSGTKTTGSLPLNFEAVYPIALTADCWLNVGITNINSKQDILAKDARYADFKAFKTGQVYGYSKRVNARGSNDFWESGAVNPQLVLADMIKILHPDLLPKHELVYYKQIL
ncbi:ABC transporter substrate-binding protein [Tellurirhabdus bombi]|uniref:ABC transporter substrate-binding protein n=1 Tax=Tellurirhabdus bombi TaxID=2907205 RepID=UPI001F242BDE|nr:ABC transporter substrate-binding protein [Tellurirhabdus bombi]